MLPRFIAFAVVMMGVFAGCGATGSAPTGVLLGYIYLSGGPATASGGAACQGTRCPGAGVVTVHDRAGKVVARERVRPHHDARFVLGPGTYEVSAGDDCSVKRSVVRAGKTSNADIVCGIS